MLCQFPEHEQLDRSRSWKVRLLHRVAQAIGVLVHIDGLPYGSARNYPRTASGSGQIDANRSSA
jgi:hypothetical protein